MTTLISYVMIGFGIFMTICGLFLVTVGFSVGYKSSLLSI